VALFRQRHRLDSSGMAPRHPGGPAEILARRQDVSRTLNESYSRQDLLSALIQDHNPQDHTGQPLPSGPSIHSRTLSDPAEVQSADVAFTQTWSSVAESEPSSVSIAHSMDAIPQVAGLPMLPFPDGAAVGQGSSTVHIPGASLEPDPFVSSGPLIQPPHVAFTQTSSSVAESEPSNVNIAYSMDALAEVAVPPMLPFPDGAAAVQGSPTLHIPVVSLEPDPFVSSEPLKKGGKWSGDVHDYVKEQLAKGIPVPKIAGALNVGRGAIYKLAKTIERRANKALASRSPEPDPFVAHRPSKNKYNQWEKHAYEYVEQQLAKNVSSARIAAAMKVDRKAIGRLCTEIRNKNLRAAAAATVADASGAAPDFVEVENEDEVLELRLRAGRRVRVRNLDGRPAMLLVNRDREPNEPVQDDDFIPIPIRLRGG
jgi:hypothetical protein